MATCRLLSTCTHFQPDVVSTDSSNAIRISHPNTATYRCFSICAHFQPAFVLIPLPATTVPSVGMAMGRLLSLYAPVLHTAATSTDTH